MCPNHLIQLKAAQNKLISEFPAIDVKDQLGQQIKSIKLQQRLAQYRNGLHQKFVVFHISETMSSIESQIRSEADFSEKLMRSRGAYQDIFVQFAENLGDAAVSGIDGNYLSMLTHSIKAVVTFFQSDSSLRTELHKDLMRKLESGGIEKLQEFVAGDTSVDAYLNALSSEHFYFQSEVERLYHSGQIKQSDFQQAIQVSSAWKEEIVTAIINLRNHNFQRYEALTKRNQQYQIAPHRDLALRLVSEFLIAPQHSGKISGIKEIGHLWVMFLNARRDAHIAEAINLDTGVRTLANLQGRSLEIDKNSVALKAIVATLKRQVIAQGQDTFVGDDEHLLSVLSEHLSLAFKANLTDEEKFQFYADYYFNQVEREAVSDELLEKRLIPTYGFFDNKPDKEDKGRTFFETLKYLGRGLLQTEIDHSQGVEINRALLMWQEKIQTILNHLFLRFKEKLLSSTEMKFCNERKVKMLVMQYLNHQLKQLQVSRFYQSYLHGLVDFIALLPQPHQVMLVEDVKRPGQVKVAFLGAAFNRLNELNGNNQSGWGKGRTPVLFSPSHKEEGCACKKIAVNSGAMH